MIRNASSMTWRSSLFRSVIVSISRAPLRPKFSSPSGNYISGGLAFRRSPPHSFGRCSGAIRSLPMTQTSNRFFDEVARLMNDAAGVAQGIKREVDTMFKTQAEKWLRDLDL